MSLNHIVLVGTLDRPPEKRTTPEGVGTTTFRLKVLRPSRSGAEGDDAATGAASAPSPVSRPERFDVIPVLCVRRLSDIAAELRAGETVAVEGRLETYQLPGEQYKNGVRVFAESVQRLGVGGPAQASGSDGDEFTAHAAALASTAATAGTAGMAGTLADELPPDLDDSIPF